MIFHKLFFFSFEVVSKDMWHLRGSGWIACQGVRVEDGKNDFSLELLLGATEFCELVMN